MLYWNEMENRWKFVTLAVRLCVKSHLMLLTAGFHLAAEVGLYQLQQNCRPAARIACVQARGFPPVSPGFQLSQILPVVRGP